MRAREGPRVHTTLDRELKMVEFAHPPVVTAEPGPEPVAPTPAPDPVAAAAPTLVRDASGAGVIQAGWERADRLLGTVLALHFPFAMLLAFYRSTFVPALVFGGAASAAAWLLTRHRPGQLTTRITVGVGFMIYSALLIHQTGGMIEFHFHIFASLAFLVMYRDWRVPVAAAAVIAVHHVLFHILQHNFQLPVYVFPADDMHGWGIVFIHAAFVVYETIILVFLTQDMLNEARQSESLVEVARDLGRGRIRKGVRGQGGAVGVALDALGESMDNLAATIQAIRERAGQVATSARSLADTSRHLQDASESLGNQAGELTTNMDGQLASAEDVGQVTTQFSAAVEEVSAGAASQAEDTARMASAAEEMIRAVEEVANLSKEVMTRAEAATNVARDGYDVVQRAVDGMQRLTGSVNGAARQIEELEGRSQEIHGILDVLNTISEQTNLLALNATIEAARAGEHGKGFAVVAAEVRELANRSARSTQEIGELLEAIRSQTAAAYKTMEDGTQMAEEGARLAEQAGSVLEEVLRATESSASDAARIAQSAEQISGRGRDVGSRIQSVAVITQQNSQATETMARDSDRVAGSIHKIVDQARVSAESANQVTQVVGAVAGSAGTVSESAAGLDRIADDLMATVAAFEI